MELYINTAHKDYLELALKEKGKFLVRKVIKTNFNQSEKLWPNLDKLLKTNKIKPTSLKKIVVASSGGSFTRAPESQKNNLTGKWLSARGSALQNNQNEHAPVVKTQSFTSLRIGIAAANALAFAWGIKVEDEQGRFKKSNGLQIVEPIYDREANIG